MIRLFLGLWLVVALGSLGYGYVVEWLADVSRSSRDEPPEGM